MVTETLFKLTTRDHAILQTMLERHRGPRGPYAALLERKVRDSAIFFRDDIPPGVVTLNTRFTCLVDGRKTGPHLLVQSQGDDLPPFAVSIHSLRGLALIGLAERSSLTIDIGAGRTETLTVGDVLSQPEAEARATESLKGLRQADSAGRTQNVVAFRSLPASRPGGPRFDPDDDPGPRAA